MMLAALQGRQRVVALVAAVVVLVVGVVLAIALGGRDGGPAASSSGASSSSEPSASDSSGSSSPSPSSSSSSSPSSDSPSASGSADPQEALSGLFGDQPLTVVPPDEVATPATGVQVELASVKAVTSAGEGVGQVNGPALLLTFTVTNGTDAAVPLDALVVTAYEQGTPVPVSPVDRDPQASPLAGSIEPGASATGSYVFADPGAPLTVAVQLDTTSSVIVFDGVVAS